ncbi:MAG: hypothetical protein HYY18_04630 [Planctomycetes bacterium]|nr:hypothetical protein [Planctomycetota bacterium]
MTDSDSPGPAGVRLQSAAVQAVLVCLAVALTYANALEADFILDDTHVVRDNPLLNGPGRLGDLFRTPYGPPEARTGLYRPLLMATFLVDRWLLGPGASAAGFHLMNVLWHAAACLALLLLLRMLCGPGPVALAGALLFAVHPVHAEAVTGLVGRADLQAALASILAVACYERQRIAAGPRVLLWSLAGSVVLGLGLLCKEAAVAAPGLCLLVEWYHRRAGGEGAGPGGIPRVAAALALHGAAILAYLIARRAVVGAVGVEQALFTLAGTDPLCRLLVMGRVLLDELRLCFLPIGLSASYAVNTRPDLLTVRHGDVLAWAAFGLVASLVAFAVAMRRKCPVLALGLGWFWISILPVSNLLFPIGAIRADRFLYLPSAGICLVLAAGLTALSGRLRSANRPAWAAAAGSSLVPALLTVGILLTHLRNYAWSNPEAYWKDAIARQPADPFPLVGLAQVRYDEAWDLRLRGDEQEAIRRLEEAAGYAAEAVRLRPDFGPFQRLHGEILAALGRHREAAEAFTRALRSGPQLSALVGRGMCYVELGAADPSRRREFYGLARRDFEEALARNPQFEPALRALEDLEKR